MPADGGAAERGINHMSQRVKTHDEAKALAAEWREIFAGCDYVVRIIRPYFDGDDYMVVMGV